VAHLEVNFQCNKPQPKFLALALKPLSSTSGHSGVKWLSIIFSRIQTIFALFHVSINEMWSYTNISKIIFV